MHHMQVLRCTQTWLNTKQITDWCPISECRSKWLEIFLVPIAASMVSQKRCLISACQPSEATFLELTRLLKVPKGLVLELFKFKNSKHLSWSSLGIWLSHIYGKPVNHTEIQEELRKMRVRAQTVKEQAKGQTKRFQWGAFRHPTLLSQLFHLSFFQPFQLIQKRRHRQTAAKESTGEAVKDKELKRQLQRWEMKLEDTVTKLRGSIAEQSDSSTLWTARMQRLLKEMWRSKNCKGKR